MPETYPKTIHKLPTNIAGYEVLAWVTAKNSDGNYPGGYVLAYKHNEVQPYAVWMVCTRDGGETWQVAGSGQYSFVYEDAAEDFAQRMAGSNIAMFPLREPEPSPREEGENLRGIDQFGFRH